MPRKAAITALEQAVDAREGRFREQRQANDQGFLGINLLLNTKPTQRAKQEQNNENDTESNRPRYIKCFDPERRLKLQIALREFRIAYSIAREAFKHDKSVVFPYGTRRLPYLEKAVIDSPSDYPLTVC